MTEKLYNQLKDKHGNIILTVSIEETFGFIGETTHCISVSILKTNTIESVISGRYNNLEQATNRIFEQLSNL